MKCDYIEQGDCLELMKQIPDGAIDLTVTSPPYDNLRTYKGNINQWCFEKFQAIARELYRITKSGGVVVWVVGDATINGSETGTSFKQALYFKECGFNLHDTMIYAKNNPIPQNHNRYEQSFEFMLVFSKGKPNAFNPLMEPTKNNGKQFDWGNRKTTMDANQCRRHRESENLTVKPTKIRKNIFYYSIGGGKTGHPAVFPEQLAQDHILSWSNSDDIVFDPFLGSGTTAKMAALNNRHYIGFELEPEYYEIAVRQLDKVKKAEQCESDTKENINT